MKRLSGWNVTLRTHVKDQLMQTPRYFD